MRTAVLGLLACFAMLTTATAENWPQWRGPKQTGMAEGKSYPIKWEIADNKSSSIQEEDTKDTSKNIRWTTELPGPGSSTPAVWENHIFVTCTIDETNAVVCYDRKGTELWQTELTASRGGKHKKATGCNPSPTTDGKHVFVYFKSGELACLDFKGKVVWKKNLQKSIAEDSLWWDLGTSPVLTNKAIVVACMQEDKSSYVVAYEKATGKQLWKQDRKLGAPSEAAQSYSTPMVVNDGKNQTLIILGADHVTAHNAETGKEIWRVGGLNPTKHKFFRSIASPVVSGNLVIAPYARKKSLTAIRLGGKGNVTKSHIAWFDDKNNAPDVPTPATDGKKVYICKDKGTLLCLDAKSGKKLWETKVEKSRTAFSSSPVIAGKYVYITRENGTTYVIDTESEKHEVVATNHVRDLTVATPVFVDGLVLIRTRNYLVCIGKK